LLGSGASAELWLPVVAELPRQFEPRSLGNHFWMFLCQIVAPARGIEQGPLCFKIAGA